MSVAVPVEAVAKAEPIKAVYAHMDALMTGIEAMKKAGVRDNMIVITPFPRHEVEDAIYEGEPSPVRWFTLVGGLFGATMAFSLTALTSANWPMILPGGKPVVSVPPFIVITFEGTILWASLFTFFAMCLFGRLPASGLPKEVEDDRFSNDHFGIIVEKIGAHEASHVKSLLRESGALEVSGGEAPVSAEGHHA
jgi:hypothetical protein